MLLKEKDANLLKRAIDEWKQQQIISDEQASQMDAQIEKHKLDWKQVAVYAFIIAVSCAILSIVVLLADDLLREFIERYTQLTDIVFSIILSISTFFTFWYTKKRFKKYINAPIGNTSFLLLGAFLSLACVSFWAKSFHVFQNEYYAIFLIAAILYIIVSVYFQSNTLWVLCLLMFGLAYGSFTLSLETKDQFFLGMNLILRYIPFSVLLFVGLYFVKQNEKCIKFEKIHYISSLLVFFTAIWLLSIFGNFTKYENWQQVGQIHFVIWAIALFMIAALGMYVGLKREDFILGNISLIFFILNLITRYFEYFWEPLHKSVFFMILAFIFWFIGSRAEKLWNLKFLDENYFQSLK